MTLTKQDLASLQKLLPSYQQKELNRVYKHFEDLTTQMGMMLDMILDLNAMVRKLNDIARDLIFTQLETQKEIINRKFASQIPI